MDYKLETTTDYNEYKDDSYVIYKNMIRDLNRPLLTYEQQKELFNKMKLGDLEAKKILIESNLRLVITVLKQIFKDKPISLDAIQNGNVGLIKAVEKFDVDLGYKFSTYAVWWIKREILYKNYTEKRIIRIPFEFETKYLKYINAKKELICILKRYPTDIEIVNHLKESNKFIDEINYYKSTLIYAAIDFPVNKEDDECNLSEVLSNNSPTCDDLLIEKDKQERINILLGNFELTEREKEILKLRFGYYNQTPFSLEKIGNIYGITKSRVEQIEKKIFRKIRLKKELLLDLGKYLYDDEKLLEIKINELTNKAKQEVQQEREKNKQKRKLKKETTINKNGC